MLPFLGLQDRYLEKDLEDAILRGLETFLLEPGDDFSFVARQRRSVTNGRMQEITGEHSKDITGVLQTLVRDGLLTQQNQRRWASYRVAEDSPLSGDDSNNLAGNSPQSSPQLADDSTHLAPSSPHLPPELLSLAEPARIEGKLPAAEMQALVVRLCRARWPTSKDLAALASRDAANLQGRILPGW